MTIDQRALKQNAALRLFAYVFAEKHLHCIGGVVIVVNHQHLERKRSPSKFDSSRLGRVEFDLHATRVPSRPHDVSVSDDRPKAYSLLERERVMRSLDTQHLFFAAHAASARTTVLRPERPRMGASCLQAPRRSVELRILRSTNDGLQSERSSLPSKR
ncbi:hypothetical protein, partial [Pararobbsia alpina]|uniref:hypothetical protein n=1 Tax=Pararobbsia alpina TaxID=621374 RepID=UPI001C2EA083